MLEPSPNLIVIISTKPEQLCPYGRDTLDHRYISCYWWLTGIFPRCPKVTRGDEGYYTFDVRGQNEDLAQLTYMLHFTDNPRCASRTQRSGILIEYKIL